jgi:hypothetical protein
LGNFGQGRQGHKEHAPRLFLQTFLNVLLMSLYFKMDVFMVDEVLKTATKNDQSLVASAVCTGEN